MSAMEGENSAHYALKIAVNILRERCQLFQERITILEEENINLKLICQKNESNKNSWSEVDSLKRQIASFDEQNSQLQSKMRIIAQENQQLWANLGKLSHANKSLGSQLNKINDTLSQHVNSHQPLIRSKTFTQDKSPAIGIIQENSDVIEKNKLDLEDISLKLINSMSEVKNEVDSLVQDITDVGILDNIITSSLGFSYDDENEDIIEDLKIILEELNYIKNESGKQNLYLKESLTNLRNMKEQWKCPHCKDNIIESGKNSSLKDNEVENDHHSGMNESDDSLSPRICPICRKLFGEEVDFTIFVSHVESHFKFFD